MRATRSVGMRAARHAPRYPRFTLMRVMRAYTRVHQSPSHHVQRVQAAAAITRRHADISKDISRYAFILRRYD